MLFGMILLAVFSGWVGYCFGCDSGYKRVWKIVESSKIHSADLFRYSKAIFSNNYSLPSWVAEGLRDTIRKIQDGEKAAPDA